MKTQLSILALAVAATTSASAFDPARDKSLGSELDHIIAYVNNDNGNVGSFIVKNGEPGKTGTGGTGEVETFNSSRHDTTIKTSSGTEFKLDDKGAHLSDITLDGVKDGAVNKDSTEAINGSQLFKSQDDAAKNLAKDTAAREAANKKLAEDLAKEEKERKEAINKERDERIAADNKLTADLAQETKDRIEGDRQTLAAANAYTDQKVNKLEKHYKAAVASSIAIASLPQPTTAGKNMFSIGAGTWESEQGYALGVSGVTMDNKWVYKVAASGDSRGNFGGGASVGFQW